METDLCQLLLAVALHPLGRSRLSSEFRFLFGRHSTNSTYILRWQKLIVLVSTFHNGRVRLVKHSLAWFFRQQLIIYSGFQPVHPFDQNPMAFILNPIVLIFKSRKMGPQCPALNPRPLSYEFSILPFTPPIGGTEDNTKPLNARGAHSSIGWCCVRLHDSGRDICLFRFLRQRCFYP